MEKTTTERAWRGVAFPLTRWHGEVFPARETEIEVRVRYVETDQMGVVYHANHLVWFEMGRIDWLDQIGIPYKEIESKGICLPVTEIAARYMSPARFDERVRVLTRLVGLTKARARFAYRLLGPTGVPLSEGYSEHAVVDKEMRPIRAPEWLREKMTGPLIPTARP